ncbi:hypothetical protein [Paenibacillus alba]|uniref:Uncharacterized protein n=1 Tax=Paenibacillus alba TaxID=1197127 RepID=A0ABU6G9S8_9BACL|nr:hypothetical protein [Paenibacillus alba]MEC0230369.1 hypothetical protein [Paenibacillus alba]NQX69226.1 hypothetical protein [Paenibacillus alba]
MSLVLCLIFAWFSIFVFAALPNKLSITTNVLLYMILAIVDINKLTLLSHVLHFFQLSTQIPKFLSVIVHRDLTFSLTLLTFANVYLTTPKSLTKIGISLYSYAFLVGSGQWLRWTGAITYVKWNIFYECLLILLLHVLVYGMGRWLLAIKQKEV